MSVEQNLNILKSCLRKDSKLNSRLESLYKYYLGEQIAQTPSFGNETTEHKNMRPKFAPNFYRKAINDLSYLYAQNPIRSSETYEKWEELFWEKNDGINSLLLEADCLTRIGGTSLAVIMPDEFGINMYVFPKWRFSAISEDGTNISAVLVKWKSEDDLVYIDSEIIYNIKDGTFVEHGIGIAPFCLLKNTISSNCIYGEPLGGVDILQNLKTINLQFEEITYVSMLQRGQPVVVGDKATNLALGCDTPIYVDQVGGFTFVSNAANIPSMLSILQMNLDSLAIALGISKHSFNVRTGLDSVSADTIYASQLELYQDRQVRERIAKGWEKRIHTIAKYIAENTFNVILDIPKVKFVEFVRPISPSDTLAKVDLESNLGLADKETLAQQLNPSSSPVEIAEQVEMAAQEMAEDNRQMAVVAGRSEESNMIVDKMEE